ncbi:MAG: helix-turn-helix transcriptional regulator [Robiginitomaculum sp.]|nr:helix-turn-helix transcriptional regulator [Robiginitomaculum sp.]
MHWTSGVEHLILSPKGLCPYRAERECLTWVAMGKTDREVAALLDISERTVVFHIKNAKAKLGASTRLQAVLTAIRNVEVIL